MLSLRFEGINYSGSDSRLSCEDVNWLSSLPTLKALLRETCVSEITSSELFICVMESSPSGEQVLRLRLTI